MVNVTVQYTDTGANTTCR